MIGDFKSISVIDEVEEFQEQRQSRIANIFNKKFSLSNLFKKSTVDLQAVVDLPDHSEENPQEIVIKDIQAEKEVADQTEVPKKGFLSSLMEQRLQKKFFETKKFVASEVTLV
jgi:hypothetical protein